MPGLEILEVTIGIVLVYLVLSLICTSIVDALGQWRNLRGKNLRTAIQVLLGTELADRFYRHENIAVLCKEGEEIVASGAGAPPAGGKAPRVRDPSHIEPETFTSVTLDLVLGRDWMRLSKLPTCLRSALQRSADPAEATAPLAGQDAQAAPADGPVVRQQRARVAGALTAMLDEAGGDFAAFQSKVAEWYDDTCNRAKGWFRRAVGRYLIGAGFVIAVLANADTVQMFQRLSSDSELRKAAVETAVQRVNAASAEEAEAKQPDGEAPAAPPAGGAASSPKESVLQQIKKEAGDIAPIVGWSESDALVLAWKEDDRSVLLAVLLKLVGLALTAFAVSLGAPFWFDLLRKLVNVRAASRERGKEAEAAAEAGGGASSAAGSPSDAQPAAGGSSEAPAQAYATGMTGFVPWTREFQVANAYWLARCAAMAYREKGEDDAACESRIQRVFAGWGMQAEFHSVSDAKRKVDTQFFVAADDNILIVSFRGTEPDRPTDFLTDAKYELKKPWGLDRTRVRVHTGFHDGVDVVWDRLLEVIGRLHDRGQSIWLTGHSLGGALAVVAASRLAPELAKRRKGELPARIYGVYTIGQPRCGNEAFVEDFEKALPGAHYRVINNRDLVPRVPLRAMKYEHSGRVCYFDEFGRLHRDPGLWYRMLDTLLVSLDDVKDRSMESVRDHGAEHYVALLGKAAGLDVAIVAA